jgi:hypothetical protein
VDWWERLLAAYRDGDPDGNGKADTQPWPSVNGFYLPDSWMWGGVRGCYGPTFGPILEDGKLTMAEITDGFRQWCVLMGRWAAKGFLNEDDLQKTISWSFRKISDGLVAASPVSLRHLDQSFADAWPPMSMATKDKVAEGAEVVVVPPLVGPRGERGWHISPTHGTGLYISKDVGDEKLKRILQIVDLLYFRGEENYVKALHGLPGIHFEWEGEPWNSRPVARAPDRIPRSYHRQGGFGESQFPAFQLDLLKFELAAPVLELYSRLFTEEARKSFFIPYTYDFFYDPQFETVMKKYSRDVIVTTAMFIYDTVYYKVEVDDFYWERYVNSWRLKGGDEIIKAFEKLPIAREALRGNVLLPSGS